MPSPERKRKSRRDAYRELERGVPLLDIYKLVQVDDYVAQIGERRERRKRRERRAGRGLLCMMRPLLFEKLSALRHLILSGLAAQRDAIRYLDLLRRAVTAGLFYALRKIARLQQHKFV